MVAWSGTASTKIDALSMLSRLLEGARKKGLVSYNPARDIDRPKQDESDLRSRALSPEQVELVLGMIPEGKYRRYAAALVYTGGRSGEATAARIVDDLEARVIRVRRSISPGELIEQSPKSHKWRPVPIVDAFLPYVEEAMRGKKPQDRLFDGERGGHLTNRTFVRAVDWPKIRAKLDRPDFKVHDLRHTFATLMLDAGVPAHDVQEMMGHSTLQVTERYGRSREGAAARAIPKANAVFRGPSAGQGFSGARNAATRKPKTPGGPGV